MATSDAPISIGTVTLVVNNLEKVAEFYRSAVGLVEMSKDSVSCLLGDGNKVLLYLIQDVSARPHPEEAGLFHTAFLLPTRSSLAEWYKFAKNNNIRLDGMADHGVSEAVYLSDPEGNGIEIYADRDRSEWKVLDNGMLDIVSTSLKTNHLLTSANDIWQRVPEGTVVGHVHLQVGELNTADDFYLGDLGFQSTSRMASASFYGSGGYHHHLAGNIWNSRNASQRSKDSTGLLEVELLISDAAAEQKNVVDPWGTRFKLTKTATV